MITLRLKPTQSSLRVRAALAVFTPELQAAVNAAEAAQQSAEADRIQTGLDRIATGNDVIATGNDAIATAADRVQTGLDRIATGNDAVATAADRVQTGLDRIATGEDVIATAADRLAAEEARDAAELAAENFGDEYLGALTSDPTTDNQGGPLSVGNLYWNSVSGNLRIYNGSSWVAYSAASGMAALVDDSAPALGGNLDANGHTIAGRDVAADGTKLDGIEALADVTDATNVGAAIHGATGKATPVDADELALIDSAASNVLKKLTWANLKATAKSYFDAIYATGPASVTDSRPALFDGTTGKLLKQASAALGDAAFKNTGTTTGTLAAGDDSRITGAAQKAGNQNLTGGFTTDVYSIGDVSTGTVTPSPLNGAIQSYNNKGAHTLAPYTTKACSFIVDVINGSGAGAITTSGFTIVKGDSFDTTSSHVFRCYISYGAGGSSLDVRAMQ